MKNKINKDNLQKELKKKWLKNNIIIISIVMLAFLAIYIIAKMINNYIVISINTILIFLAYFYIRNKMMIFVENEVYGKKQQ